MKMTKAKLFEMLKNYSDDKEILICCSGSDIVRGNEIISVNDYGDCFIYITASCECKVDY